MEEEGTGKGGWESIKGEDGRGHTGKGVGGMVVSTAFDTQVCLLAMSSEVMESLGSSWLLGVIFIPDELVLTVSKHLGPC